VSPVKITERMARDVAGWPAPVFEPGLDEQHNGVPVGAGDRTVAPSRTRRRTGTGEARSGRARIITASDGRDRVTISVLGTLHRPGVSRLRSRLASCRAAGTPQLILDLTATRGWDSGLPRALAWARIQLRDTNQELSLIGATPQLWAEVRANEAALTELHWRGAQPGQPGYRPETADQP
jgi:anti-anti-sigma regulatory factor